MLSRISIYSPSTQKLIRRLNTPEKVQRWLESLDYNKASTMRTLERVAHFRSAHCLEGAMAAAAILEFHGYSPLILDLESADLLDHTLFIFQETRPRGRRGWGAIGKSRDIGLDGRKPVFKTVEALAKSYVIPYIDAKACITSFGVLDLRTLKNTSWRTSKRNVWHVEEKLRHIKHTKIITPASIVKRWRQQFIEFKKLYPNTQPDYYSNKNNWM